MMMQPTRKAGAPIVRGDHVGPVLRVIISVLAIGRVNAQCIVTIAGPLAIPGSPATSQQLMQPSGIVSDGASGWFFADVGTDTIQRIRANGTMAIAMGTPRSTTTTGSGDGGLATSALLNNPANLASDGAGGVLVADRGMNIVRRLCANGTTLRVAGNLSSGSSGNGGLAIYSTLAAPAGVAGDGAGRVWVADTGNNAIRLVSLSGVITRAAGVASGAASYLGDGGPATLAGLNAPQAVLADGAGGVWIADTNNSVIRRLFANGTIITWAGTGVAAYCSGPARAACFSFPAGLASDGAGGLLVADSGNSIVRRVSVNGTVSCVAGTPLVRNYTGDGGPATLATAGAVTGVAGDGLGGFAFTDATFLVVRYVTATGVISTIVGTGLGFTGSIGNGGPAFSARLNSPYMIAGDAASILVVDRNNHAIRRIFTANLSFADTTLAGVMSSAGSTGNGGPASLARLNNPYSIASDGSGGWLIVDTYNGLVRRVFANGTIVVAAGNRSLTLGADGRPATLTALSSPNGVSPVDPVTGTFCIADSASFVVRRVYPNGTALIVAGTAGVSGSFGSGVPGTMALLSYPRGLSLGPASSDVVIADSGSHAIRILFANGSLSTLAGTLGVSGSVNGPATSAQFNQPSMVSPDGLGGYFVSNTGSNLVQRVFANRTVITTVGTLSGYVGDGGSPLRARMLSPQATYWDGAILWIADNGNAAVRAVLPPQQCVASSTTQLVGCRNAANGSGVGSVVCGFTGLSQVPPLYAWLAGAACNTTVQPTPATGGAANVSCPFAAQGTLQWLTQFGSASSYVVIASASQSISPTCSRTPSGLSTPSATTSSSKSPTPTFSASGTASASVSQAATASSTGTSSDSLAGSPSESNSGTATVAQTASVSPTHSSTMTPTTSPYETASTTQSQSLAPTRSQVSTPSSSSYIRLSSPPSSSTSQGVLITLALSASQTVTTMLAACPTPTPPINSTSGINATDRGQGSVGGAQIASSVGTVGPAAAGGIGATLLILAALLVAYLIRSGRCAVPSATVLKSAPPTAKLPSSAALRPTGPAMVKGVNEVKENPLRRGVAEAPCGAVIAKYVSQIQENPLRRVVAEAGMRPQRMRDPHSVAAPAAVPPGVVLRSVASTAGDGGVRPVPDVPTAGSKNTSAGASGTDTPPQPLSFQERQHEWFLHPSERAAAVRSVHEPMQARSSSARGSQERSQSISPGRALARSRTSGSPALDAPRISSSPALCNVAAPLARTRAKSSSEGPRTAASTPAPSPTVPSAPSPAPTPPPPSRARASPVAPTDGIGRSAATGAVPPPKSELRPAQTFQERQRAWFAHPSDVVGQSVAPASSLPVSTPSSSLPVSTPSSSLPVSTPSAARADPSVPQLQQERAEQRDVQRPQPQASQTLSFQERQRAWFAHPSDLATSSVPPPPPPLRPEPRRDPPQPSQPSRPPQSFQERQRSWFAHPSDAP